MLYKRHKVLLALLDAVGGRAERVDFQKLLLLYCLEWEAEASYDFVPHRRGAFSFTSHADLRKLVRDGLVLDSEGGWELTALGRSTAREAEPRERILSFAAVHQDLRGSALVETTYRRHPWSATRSQIAEEVLRGDPVALSAIRSACPARGAPGICTIGYEGRSLEAYLCKLLWSGVTVLCDVRRNPQSRRFGFSKKALAGACGDLEVRYEHLPEFGIPGSQRKHLHSQSDYEDLFASYARDYLPEQDAALSAVHGWVTAGERVALTCFERQPERCHRSCVAQRLMRVYGGASIEHL